MKGKLILLAMLLPGWATYAQNFSDKLSRELSFEKRSADNAIIISNIFGSVNIVGYNGDKVLIEVARTIEAKTDARLQAGKAEVQLGIMDRADTIIVYVKDGCHNFGPNTHRSRSGGHAGGWGYHSPSEGDCNLTYDYKMDFTIKVPLDVHIIAGTINDGDVVVDKVAGVVKTNNVNGSIRLTNLKSAAEARTINGDVDVEYATNPTGDCYFYSLNGDINALFQPGLSAETSFKSFNGDLYTNISGLQMLPLQVQKASHGNGIKYKIDGSRYQIGSGGVLLDFETFNGSAYLKEKK